jgi:hypothetical protein
MHGRGRGGGGESGVASVDKSKDVLHVNRRRISVLTVPVRQSMPEYARVCGTIPLVV